MAQDISGFGLILTIKASRTYPLGVIIQDFADDVDPFDAPPVVIAATGMGLNGDLVKYSSPKPLPFTIGLIPGSVSDIAMGILVDQNRVGKGKTGARDVITAIGVYPNGKIIRYTNGIIISGPVAPSVASSGRIKSNVYGFEFEGKSGA